MFSLSQNYLTRGFWGDEAWTSLISQLPYSQMLSTTAQDFHPPGYYSVIELVYQFFPPTEVITRSVSIFFYILTLFLVYKLASELKGKIFGIASIAVVALNPIFFTYAFEARNYTMFAFAAVGSIYFLIRLSEKFSVLRAIGFVLFSTLGIYTHYYMFFTLAAQGMYILFFDRKILLKAIGLYVVVGILYIPWLTSLLSQLTSVSNDYWIGGIDKRTHFEAILRILGGEEKNIFRPILFASSLILLAVGVFQHLLRKHFEKPYLLIWLWAVVPFILASLPGLSILGFKLPFRSIFFWRYLIPASVPLALVMVHSAQRFPKLVFYTVVSIMLLFSIYIDIATFSRYPYSFKQVYEQDVLSEINDDDKLVTVLPSFAEVLYYRNRLGLENEMIILTEGLVQFSGKSLLDTYGENGDVAVVDEFEGKFFEFRRIDGVGPNVEVGIR